MMKMMKFVNEYAGEIVVCGVVVLVCVFGVYSCVGTSHNVDKIREAAPLEIEQKGYEILRYEGWQYGSFGHHGGKVWYHVKDSSRDNVYYRMFVTMWNGELHLYYNAPEKTQNVNISSSDLGLLNLD